MSSAPDPLHDAPGEDAMAILSDSRSRVLEREGIPMFVAVDDVRPGRTLTVTDPLAREQGALLAERFERYHRRLAELGFPPDPASEGPDRTGARELIDVLVVLSDWHLLPEEARP